MENVSVELSDIAHWAWKPPAWGLAQSQDRQPSEESLDSIGALTGEILRQCVDPALEATGAETFLLEIGRKLPLFVALQVRLLEAIAASSPSDPDHPSAAEKYAAFDDRVRRWSQGLDEISRAELSFSLDTMRRSNEGLWKRPAGHRRALEAPGLADLFRATSLTDFLFSCLWRLIELDQPPEILGQVIYGLRYAALDYAAAVRRLLEPAGSLPAQESLPTEDLGEDSFWAAVGSLPLFELGDAA